MSGLSSGGWRRNDICHHLGIFHDASGDEQFRLAESAYWLFVFVFLQQAEAPSAVYHRIREHQDMIFLAPEVRSAVMSAVELRDLRQARRGRSSPPAQG